jgi:hypothetical protein
MGDRGVWGERGKIMRLIKPRKLPEANIQAELYHRCKTAGISVLLEYSVKRQDGKKCRFDAVLLKGTEIVGIIEVKSYKNPARQPNANTKQMAKYREFGVPVYLVTHMNHLHKCLQWADMLTKQ